MEKVSLNNQSDNKLTLFTMGLRMDVQPYWLIKGMISENSQNILDSMIETQFRALLTAFDKWECGVIDSLSPGVDPDISFVQHKCKTHIRQIQDIADFSRNLLDLHTDWEIFATEEDTGIIERAFEYWRYNSFYGYKKTEK